MRKKINLGVKKVLAGTLACALVLGSLNLSSLKASAVSGTITLSGSTSISPLAQELAKQYRRSHSGVNIKFTNITGSGSGISDATNGKVDIGMSSRALTVDEKKTLTENVFCNDGIAIVVNKSNPVSNLTGQQLYDLYAKKDTSWKSVSGSYNKSVATYVREAGSGTRACFEDVLKNDFALKIADNYGKIDAIMASTGAMQTGVKNNKGAIGYMSLGDLNTNYVKAVKFNNVKPSVTNVANGTYKMSRPFVFATKGTPSAATQDFIKWCKSNSTAQKIVAKMGFVKLASNKITPRSVKFSKAKVSLKKGKSFQLRYVVYPANSANKKVAFATSNKKVATVTAKGVVKAKKKGKAKITVKTVSGKKVGTCVVTVK